MEYKIEKIQYEKDWGKADIGKIIVDYLVEYDGEVIDHFETRKQAEQFIKENNDEN